MTLPAILTVFLTLLFLETRRYLRRRSEATQRIMRRLSVPTPGPVQRPCSSHRVNRALIRARIPKETMASTKSTQFIQHASEAD